MPAVPEPGGHATGPATDRQLARRLLIASALGYAAMVACYLLVIHTSLGRRFDRAAYLGIPGQSPTATKVNETILQQINGYSLGLALLILVAIGVWRRRPLLGVAAAFAAGLAVLLADLLKAHVFTTPSMFSTPSFPSGHTATAVACAMALLFVTPPARRGVAAVISGSYGWATAAQVQLAGWHRLSDAIGATCLAFASVAAVAGVLAWMRPVDRDRRGIPKWAVAVLGAVALAAAVLTAWGLVSVLGNLRHHSPGTESPAVHHAAYLTGIALTIGVVMVLLLVLIVLFGRWDFGGRGGIVVSRSLMRPLQITRRSEETKRNRQPAGGGVSEAARSAGGAPPGARGRL